MSLNLPKNKQIVLFDGVCNLCNASVNTIIKQDKNDVFRFASLQSDFGKKLINYLGIDTENTDSIILYQPNKAYFIKSDAALLIAKEFNGFWGLTQLFWIFPKDFRDTVYDFIAKKRYRWFGKKEQCMMPTKKLKHKFLDD